MPKLSDLPIEILQRIISELYWMNDLHIHRHGTAITNFSNLVEADPELRRKISFCKTKGLTRNNTQFFWLYDAIAKDFKLVKIEKCTGNTTIHRLDSPRLVESLGPYKTTNLRS